MINQLREVNFVHIIYPILLKYYEVVILVNYCAVGLIKHHVITIITKVTDTKQVIFKTIYQPHIINRDITVTN